MNLEYINTSNNNHIIKLHGEMDALGCTHIRTELEQITNSDSETNVVINMDQVKFLDSSGVGLIVFMYKRLKAKGRTLEIVDVHGQPQELMELLRIDTVIPVSMVSHTTLTSEENCA